MNESKELTVVEGVQLGALVVAPEQVVERATAIANVLANVVNERKLFTIISTRKYVRVEGWNTLGAMMGVLPREVEAKEIENGYEAIVELIRTSDGMVIGRGSAICTRDEKNWAKRDDYAVRSMAITRATGKAFRLGFSWIMKLAGYEPTPYEEMPEVVEGEAKEVEPKKKNPAPKKEPSKRPYPADYVRDRMTHKVVNHKGKRANEKQFGLAMGCLNLCFAGDKDSEDKRHSVLAYLFRVDSGNDLKGPQTLALLDWLEPEKDSGDAYAPSANAVKEAQGIVAERIKELGQEELFDE